jgi:hypothetical protein
MSQESQKFPLLPFLLCFCESDQHGSLSDTAKHIPKQDGPQLALLRHQHSTRVRPQCVVNKRQSVAASDSTGACSSITSVRTTPQAGEVGREGLVYRTGLGPGVFGLTGTTSRCATVARVNNSRLEEKTKRFYRNGWRLLKVTCVAAVRINQITGDCAEQLTFPASAANAHCALRTLRRMLHKRRSGR